jgi:uncharacterized HAD superfamily protein/hypoxanthine phosphoribosyltransferase
MDNVAALWGMTGGQIKARIFDTTPLQFRSVSATNDLIKSKLHQISGKYDIVVGVPRSGLLFANLIALNLNLRLASLSTFSKHDIEATYIGRNMFSSAAAARPDGCRVLVVDDSTNSGGSMNRARAKIAAVGEQIKLNVDFLAVYVTKTSSQYVDMFFEIVEQPRVFEWNFIHHSFARNFLFDLDGVICQDGPAESSDYSDRYIDHLVNAKPKIIPAMPIGAVVTSRLEKYRPQTEAWLSRHNVQYTHLIMLGLPSAEERRRLAVHAKFKADVYQTLGGQVFVESETWQAEQIAALTKKQVYNLQTSELLNAASGMT